MLVTLAFLVLVARTATAHAAATWFASGNALANLVTRALDAFGVVTYPQSAGSPAGEIGRYYQSAPAMQVMTGGFVWHSNEETAASISPGTLAAITRTYAKVIADSGALSLQELRKSVAPATKAEPLQEPAGRCRSGDRSRSRPTAPTTGGCNGSRTEVDPPTTTLSKD